MINKLLYHLEADEGAVFDEGEWYFVCDRVTRQWLSRLNSEFLITERTDKTAGTYITSFVSNTGKKFPIVQEPFLPAGKFYVHNKSDAEWGYMADYDLIEKDLAAESLMNRRLHALQAYAKQKRRRWIGEIYSLKTTYP
jgi:hypothetical protein